MLKENIDLGKLNLNDPLITEFRINISDIIEECSNLPEILSMLRLFKTIAVQRGDFPTATKFRDAERELRRQAAAFEYSWAWMNATQMQDEIKKQVAELLPSISFKPELGSKTKQNSNDDGPNYDSHAVPERRSSEVGQSRSNAPFMTAEGA